MKCFLAVLMILGILPGAFAAEPVVVFDLSPALQWNLRDETQRRAFWDEVHLVTALEGLVNRDQPRLFVRYLPRTDDFWWGEMTKPGGWLAAREIVHLKTVEELLVRFAPFYRGAVVWDEKIPATSHLASTIAGCDNLLPLRFDPATNSLYRKLAGGAHPLPVRLRLPAFPSKCDAYHWLVEKYLRAGKVNPLCLGYYPDAFWLKCWRAAGAENNALCDQDYIMAHRGLVFDLDVWDDEAPVDDPRQRPGTDAATLAEILRTAWQLTGGKTIIDVHGFVPWAYKYTRHTTAEWSAGGHHEEVATEWRSAALFSCFNACLDADALRLNAMPNASFYQHFPLAARYRQNPKPTAATLAARRMLDSIGRVIPRAYVAFYVGDYDSAAWLYQKLPEMWRDPARGKIPLSWAINPNLSQRFPLGLAWACANRRPNDWFVAGDCGAGYLNPGYLTPPRPFSDLPSGLPAWEQRCQNYYRQWDISLTGFIIQGSARPMSSEALDAYARFSPGGIVTQLGESSLHNGMPVTPMTVDLGRDPPDAARQIQEIARGEVPRFLVCRTVLKSPAWHQTVEQQVKQRLGDKVQFVDLYTLLELVRADQSSRGR